MLQQTRLLGYKPKYEYVDVPAQVVHVYRNVYIFINIYLNVLQYTHTPLLSLSRSLSLALPPSLPLSLSPSLPPSPPTSLRDLIIICSECCSKLLK